MKNKEKWITVNEASDVANVTKVSITNWINRGNIASKRNGRKWLVGELSLKEYLSSYPAAGKRGRPTLFQLNARMPRPADCDEPIEKRIETRIKKEENGCWIWSAGMQKNNPIFNTSNGERIYVRHWVFFQVTKQAGARVHPTCGRDRCVNPEHQVRSGGDIPATEFDKIKTRWALHLAHKVTLDKIGKEYGVSRQRIEQIVRDVEPMKCSCSLDTAASA